MDGCWFCLGSVAADTELVVSVGEEVSSEVWYLLCFTAMSTTRQRKAFVPEWTGMSLGSTRNGNETELRHGSAWGTK